MRQRFPIRHRSARTLVARASWPSPGGRRRSLVVLALVVTFALVAGGCGDDDDDGGSAGSVTVTISEDAIEVSEGLEAGVVEVTLDGETPEGEVDFTRVDSGVSEEAFVEGMTALLQGGPFPDFVLDNAGVYAEPNPATVTLEPGAYFVWVEAGGGGEGDAPSLLVTSVEVSGEGGAELPEADGRIVAEDYGFDVDVEAGSLYAFRNSGPEQFHHAVLFDFGDLDAAVVEENLPALFTEEEAEPPEAFADVDFENLDAGGSGVFGPGSGGLVAVELESGTTYAVACFIQDRAGGPPHAAAYGMYEVFTVD